jgi:hypothetical protein
MDQIKSKQCHFDVNRFSASLMQIFGNHNLCAVSALLRSTQCWKDLRLPDNHPLAVYTTNGTATGSVKFICESNINTTLQQAACGVYHITNDDTVASPPIPFMSVPALLYMPPISPASTSSMHYHGNLIPSLLTCAIWLARHNDLHVRLSTF